MLGFDTIFVLIKITSWLLIVIGFGLVGFGAVNLIKEYRNNDPYYNFMFFMTIMAGIVMFVSGIYLLLPF